MLQSYSPQSEASYEGGGKRLGLDHYFQAFKRRAAYFVVIFTVVLLLGAFVTAIQHPIYESEGKVLVESQDVPTDLVKPTITDTANERIQVIQQRIMTRDNLLGLVNKYGMFARERQWMSGTELLDLMRERTTFDLVDINSTPSNRQNVNTIAFTVSFEYQDPEITQRVTNDFLTLILDEDARNRTNRASETTKFLDLESQRLQGELAAIEAQIAENQAHSQGSSDTGDPTKLQDVELTKLREELAQKSAVYSDSHPTIITLKKKIAAMEQLIAKTPVQATTQANSGLVELERRQLDTEKNLEDNNRKLEEARLGEKLERDQQSERLQVIEQPVLPQSPIKPNRLKFLAIAFGLAMVSGIGAVFAAESFDFSIRHSSELLGVANGRMIVSIPYITTRAETFRRRSWIALLAGFLGAVFVAGLVGLLFFGPPIDLSGINQFWLDHLTRLSK